jgi:hypothetical protein
VADLAAAGGLELGPGEVDRDRAGPTPCQPGRETPHTGTELDHAEVVDLTERADLGLGPSR